MFSWLKKIMGAMGSNRLLSRLRAIAPSWVIWDNLATATRKLRAATRIICASIILVFGRVCELAAVGVGAYVRKQERFFECHQQS